MSLNNLIPDLSLNLRAPVGAEASLLAAARRSLAAKAAESEQEGNGSGVLVPLILDETEDQRTLDYERLALDLFALLPRYERVSSTDNTAKFSKELIQDVTTTFGREAAVRQSLISSETMKKRGFFTRGDSKRDLRARSGSLRRKRDIGSTGGRRSEDNSLVVSVTDAGSNNSSSIASIRKLGKSELVDVKSLVHLVRVLSGIMDLTPDQLRISQEMCEKMLQAAQVQETQGLGLPRNLSTLDQLTEMLLAVAKHWHGKEEEDAVFQQLLLKVREYLEVIHADLVRTIELLPYEHLIENPDCCTLADVVQCLVHTRQQSLVQVILAEEPVDVMQSPRGNRSANVVELFRVICNLAEATPGTDRLLATLRGQPWNDHSFLQMCLDSYDPLATISAVQDGLDSVAFFYGLIDVDRRKVLSQEDLLASLEVLPFVASVSVVIDVLRELREYRHFSNAPSDHLTVRELAMAKAIPEIQAAIDSVEAWVELWLPMFEDRRQEQVVKIVKQLYEAKPMRVARWFVDQLGQLHRELQSTWQRAFRRTGLPIREAGLSREEYVLVFLHHIQLTRNPRLLKDSMVLGIGRASPSVDGLFELIDTNGNGSIDRTEWVQSVDVLLKTGDWAIIRGYSYDSRKDLPAEIQEAAKREVADVKRLLAQEFGRAPMSRAQFRAFFGRIAAALQNEDFNRRQVNAWLDYLSQSYLIDRNKAIDDAQSTWGQAMLYGLIMMVPPAAILLGLKRGWVLVTYLVTHPTFLLSWLAYLVAVGSAVIYYAVIPLLGGASVVTDSEILFPIVLWFMCTCFVVADSSLSNHPNFMRALRLAELDLRGTHVPNYNTPINNGLELLNKILGFTADDERTIEDLFDDLTFGNTWRVWRQRMVFAALGVLRAVMPLVVRLALGTAETQLVPTLMLEIVVMAASYATTAYLFGVVFTLFTYNNVLAAALIKIMNTASTMTQASYAVQAELPSMRFADKFEHVLVWEKLYDYLQVLNQKHSKQSSRSLGILALFLVASIALIIYNSIIATVDVEIIALSLLDMLAVVVLATWWIRVAIRYNHLITWFVEPLVWAKSRADDYTYFNPDRQVLKLTSRVLGDTIDTMRYTRRPTRLFGFELTERVFTTLITLSASAGATAMGQLLLRRFNS